MTVTRRPRRPRPFDCRVDFADELAILARDDDRIVAVCNDSVGSSNLVKFREEFPDRLDQRRHRRAGPGRRWCRPGQRRFRPLRLCGRALPDGPGHRTDQGRRRLQPAARGPVRSESGHGLRRARPHPPLHRGSVVDAGHRRTPGRGSGRRAADPRRGPLGGGAAGSGPTSGSHGSRCRGLSAPTDRSRRPCRGRPGGDRCHDHRDRHHGLARPVGRRGPGRRGHLVPGYSTWPSSNRSTDRPYRAAAGDRGHRHGRRGHDQRRPWRRRRLARRGDRPDPDADSRRSPGSSRRPGRAHSCSTTSVLNAAGDRHGSPRGGREVHHG